MSDDLFATAINCMDGRTQECVAAYLKERFGVRWVDMITEPGPDGLLASGNGAALESIRRRVLISVEKHHSRGIAVVGHDDCAGNQVTEGAHRQMIAFGATLVRSWVKIPVVGLWVPKGWNRVVVTQD